MIDGLHAAYSGITAYARKASVHGNNIANAQSQGFKKDRVVLETQEGGGVTSRVEEVGSPELPTAPVEKVSQSESSNVDLGEEIVELNVAQRFFEINAESLRTQQETLGTLLDILA